MPTTSEASQAVFLDPAFWKTARPADIIRHVDAGATIHAQGPRKVTALHLASAAGNITAMTELLRQGADLEAQTICNETPLHHALDAGLTVVQYLIRLGANVNTPDIYGQTPLHRVVLLRQEDMLKALIAADANVHALNSLHDTPLRIAGDCREVEMMRALIAAGAPVESAYDVPENVALHFAALWGDSETAAALLENDIVDVNCQNRIHDTPLHMAAAEGHIDTVKVLIKAGANCMATNLRSRTPMHDAVINYEALRLITPMLDAGADINAADEDKNTPLHRAAMINPVAVKVLLDAGANSEARNDHGDLPLHIAARYNPEATKLLLKTDPRPNLESKNELGETPLHLAVAAQKQEAVEALIDAGADLLAKNHKGEAAMDCLPAGQSPELEKMLRAVAMDELMGRGYNE